MNVVDTVMQAYPYLFHPAVVLGLGAVLTIHWEWSRQSAPASDLWRRVAVFLAAGALSLLPSAVYMVVTGSGPMETMQGNGAQVDALVAGGIGVVAGTTWYLWRRFDWGAAVPRLMETYAIVAVPYVALSPVWNVSGHVLLSLTPALFLTLLDRRYWPTLAVPVVMVPNRIYVDAHTWPQAIGAFLLGTVLVVGVYRLRVDGDDSLPDASGASRTH
ncbi:phosphatase PAP2 family protein [Halogeometricum limi]|uniref:PAP2 superfamily protein n=1 Tax=Halogeometricum limi TaxID=555875 RepID=A0A1I6HCU7_9EURY|nr:phosphatase PAP2 family protein [Halogeometricum limi]SFR52198.1 PAP2 superfamily protein [Halogeometricum limi]